MTEAPLSKYLGGEIKLHLAFFKYNWRMLESNLLHGLWRPILGVGEEPARKYQVCQTAAETEILGKLLKDVKDSGVDVSKIKI